MYKQSIFYICKKLFEKEKFPKQFQKTILYMVWKKEGFGRIAFKQPLHPHEDRIPGKDMQGTANEPDEATHI